MDAKIDSSLPRSSADEGGARAGVVDGTGAAGAPPAGAPASGAPALVGSRAAGDAARAGDDSGADTVPGAPALMAALDDDDRFRRLVALAEEARAFLAPRAWDKLAHVERFAQAAAAANELVPSYPAPAQRRRLAHLLYPLLPAPARTRAFGPLPDDVAARGPAFAIEGGDVPKVAPSYSAFLADPAALSRIVRPGAVLLAPRSVCPGAARGACVTLVVDVAPPKRPSRVPARASAAPQLAVDDEPGAVFDVDGVATVRGHIELAPRGDDAARGRIDVRLGPDGKPLLGVDGTPQPITAPLDTLAGWLFSAGPDARGLDLRSEDDRALLLTWARALRSLEVRGRSAFAWLEDNGTPPDVRVDVVGAAVRAAVDAVARHALDPVACRITLRPDDGDGAWQARAAAALDETDMFRDVVTRASGPVVSASAPPEDTGGTVRDIVWADAVLPPGFAAGRLSAVAAGRAFARLATSMLAPLGVLPLSGLKDGSGFVVLQRLVPDGDGLRIERSLAFPAGGELRALDDAWQDGLGLALPDPKGAPRHDISAMPAWLAFFLEGLG